ncbi:MAG: 2-amino-4-hydroxy-6-hydroxymethyldihydropteridine diphosphokinase [Anaerolineae bacterium]|nr:2-amino-4-hydroxy-6-hydroxymethyldihydropteridine diphosphokinase [Anaerolineae bacterium]
MPHVYLSLGSNHNAAANLRAGVRLIGAIADVRAASTVYESPPVGGAEGAPYLNAALLIDTDLSREALKAQLVQIEDACGRIRRDAAGRKSSVVSLDLDIIVYDADPPHVDLARYAHVAVPLAEIAPDLTPPGESKPLRIVAQRFANSSLIPRDDIDLLLPPPLTS